MDSPAFITKVLLPQRRPDVLRRPRLVEFLHQHIDRRLILISAPAGYGKTTLLVDFAHDVDIPVCWYSLGTADGDVRVFIEYLIAAVQQRFPAFGSQTQAALRSSADLTKDLSAVIGVLVSEMHAAIAEYFIVVLDDYHAVDSSAQVNNALDLLLHYLPENCHIVVSSRTIPHVTLSRLAAHRQVGGLGTTDLRFTAEEIRQLLAENHKVLLPAKTAEALAAESEGWITGIILTTHTLWQGLFESIIRAKGAGGEVFDYLAGEVFAQQPANVQQFLLASSVLDQITPQLCAGLLDGNETTALLRYVEEANLFIVRLEGLDGWYRYHQLFKAFLENKLRQEQPEWHTSLQRRAAALSIERAAWDEALAHYASAGDYDEAVDVIVAHAAEMIDAGKLITLARWIDALPPDIASVQPHLLFVRGRLYVKAGEPDRGLTLLEKAYDHFVATDQPLDAARALAARSVGLAIKGQYAAAVADCLRALPLVGNSDQSLAAEVQRNLGICHGMQGHFPESVAALSEALRLHRDGGDTSGVATMHQSLGFSFARLGDVPQARKHFEQALVIWGRLGNAGSSGETLNSLGVLLYDDGDFEAAHAKLAEALAKARESSHLRLEAGVLIDMGDLHRSQQQYVEAVEHYERGLEIARRIEEGFLVGCALNGLGDTHARMGEFRRADRFIRQALLQAEERQSAYERGIYETSLGMLRCDQGEPAKAVRCLARSCELLQQVGAKRELTRAILSNARALHQKGQCEEALQQLSAALDLGAEIDFDQFLMREGVRCQALLLYAKEHTPIDSRVIAALHSIQAAAAARRPLHAQSPALQAVHRPHPALLQALALGQARVLREGKEITRSGWASDKVRELFFFLVAHSYSLSKEQIVESLWPELPAGSYNSTFHSTMYRLRRALQDEYIVHRDGRYRIAPEVECYCDATEFERAIEEAERLPRDSVEAVERYRGAVALYTGPYLKEFESEWCEVRRRQLAQKHLSALAKLASAAAVESQYGECIELCQQILASDNFREDVHYLILKCHVAIGDHTAALRHYRRYAVFLRDELSVTPQARIRALYEQILKGGATTVTSRTSSPVSRP